MEVARLGVQSELQLPAYTTATAAGDPSHVCDLHHSSRRCQIPDPLSEARDQTHILMDTRRIRFRCATTGTPQISFIFYLMSFSLPGTIAFSCRVSFSASWLQRFLRLSLSLIILTVLRSTGQEFCRLLLRWDLSDAFLLVVKLEL